MERFLSEISKYIYSEYTKKLSNLTLVFPNRRAGVFFQKYLSEQIYEPIFSPQITTVSDFVQSLSDLVIADRLHLIIELHQIVNAVMEKDESLDDFYFWGEMMLNDFDDIDKYMVDAKQLFTNIEELQEIDSGFEYLSEEQRKMLQQFWDHIQRAKPSSNKSDFLNIWRRFYTIYSNFKTALQKNGLAYEGMLYRSMAERIKTNKTIETQDTTFVFIGFNALNACEQQLFDTLQKKNKALFFWDYDNYYTDKDFHEAGMFIRENLVRYPMPQNFNYNSNNFVNTNDIELVPVPSLTGQVSYTSEWLKKFLPKTDTIRFDNTAVVLCDEDLLPPMLDTLTAVKNQKNITMGYPLKSCSIFSLVNRLIELDKNARPTIDKNNQTHYTFYYKTVRSILNHPLIKPQLEGNYETLLNTITEKNQVYLSSKDFEGNDVIQKILSIPETTEKVADYVQAIIAHLFNALDDNDSTLIDKESLYQFHLIINRFNEMVFDQKKLKSETISKRLYYKLLMRHAERCTIPFEGEPLFGLQLMGFLETRCLDFENIILLSVNDNRMPGAGSSHSFIPYSLRRGFALPTIERKNAMFAYYFYRLIQRSKNIAFVYDSRVEGMNTGEMSRFITQLNYEFVKPLKQVQTMFSFEPGNAQEIEIKKDDQVINKLVQNFNGKLLSPSAINIYLMCKLRFFFRYVARIYENEELTEDIDQLFFGRIAHLALEKLYLEAFPNREITADRLNILLKNQTQIDKALSLALREEFLKTHEEKLNGKNILVFDIIKKYVCQVIKFDASVAPFKIAGIEKKYTVKYNIKAADKNITVELGGTIDRLDEREESIRVVDYKTGAAENNVKDIEKLFIGKETGKYKAALQTLIYAKCVENSKQFTKGISPAVYGLRTIFKSDFNPVFIHNKKELLYNDVEETFDINLKDLIQEIFSEESSFTQVEDVQKCSFCPYASICNR